MTNIVEIDLKEYLGKTVKSFDLYTNAELNIFFENDLTISGRVNTAVHHMYCASTVFYASSDAAKTNLAQSILDRKIRDVMITANGYVMLSFSGGCELTLTSMSTQKISFP